MCNLKSIWAWPCVLCFYYGKTPLNAWSQAVINGDHIVDGSVALWCDGGAHFELKDWWIQAKPEQHHSGSHTICEYKCFALDFVCVQSLIAGAVQHLNLPLENGRPVITQMVYSLQTIALVQLWPTILAIVSYNIVVCNEGLWSSLQPKWSLWCSWLLFIVGQCFSIIIFGNDGQNYTRLRVYSPASNSVRLYLILAKYKH